jgi:hypothetical protein
LAKANADAATSKADKAQVYGYMYVHVCMYVCMYVFVCNIHACIYAYTHTHTLTHSLTHSLSLSLSLSLTHTHTGHSGLAAVAAGRRTCGAGLAVSEAGGGQGRHVIREGHLILLAKEGGVRVQARASIRAGRAGKSHMNPPPHMTHMSRASRHNVSTVPHNDSTIPHIVTG